ncbi:MAG: 2-amino-4-hydroxy-6-hydroxymethyldihydropteridine diphosphokinase [Holophagaceae bacterium]|nr:2-amino-4-hydroxy-6-hydroxymethyldihydropteridine diphosphokinase [Holophagaceae bacterium]
MKSVIALGSNLGGRQAHLDAGLIALCTLGAVVPSPLVMETPDESGRGPAYLNTVAILVTEEADPCRLLESLLRWNWRMATTAVPAGTRRAPWTWTSSPRTARRAAGPGTRRQTSAPWAPR